MISTVMSFSVDEETNRCNNLKGKGYNESYNPGCFTVVLDVSADPLDWGDGEDDVDGEESDS